MAETSSSASRPTLFKIQTELDKAKGMAKDNIVKISERGERLDALQAFPARHESDTETGRTQDECLCALAGVIVLILLPSPSPTECGLLGQNLRTGIRYTNINGRSAKAHRYT